MFTKSEYFIFMFRKKLQEIVQPFVIVGLIKCKDNVQKKPAIAPRLIDRPFNALRNTTQQLNLSYSCFEIMFKVFL